MPEPPHVANSPPDTGRDPAALRCLDCGYDLRGSESLRCPECGNKWNREAIERRTRFARSTPLAAAKMFAVVGVAILLGALLIEGFFHGAGGAALLFWIVLSASIMVITIGVGTALSLIAPRAYRINRPALWLRPMIWVLGPWLIVPLMLPMIDRSVSGFVLLYVCSTIAALVLWVLHFAFNLRVAGFGQNGQRITTRLILPYVMAAMICIGALALLFWWLVDLLLELAGA